MFEKDIGRFPVAVKELRNKARRTFIPFVVLIFDFVL